MAQLLCSGTSTSTAGFFFVAPEPFIRGANNAGSVFFRRKCTLRAQAGRVSSFFFNGRRKEEARKALENAFSENKDQFDQWNQKIEKRNHSREGGGGTGTGTGRGGWSGGGGWYSWFGGDGFWEEAPKVVLAVFGIGLLYLLLAKGELISAVIFNPFLDVLRKVCDTISCLFSRTPQSGQLPAHAPASETVNSSYQTPTSAKERVIRKWAMD